MLLVLAAMPAAAQKFFNLTASEVSADSGVPEFTNMEELPTLYADSVYTMQLLYPEFVDMPQVEVERYRALTDALPPAMPQLNTSVVLNRKRPLLHTSFCPVVHRNGRYQLLVSFMLQRKAVARHSQAARLMQAIGKAPAADDDSASVPGARRYAKHSVLRKGKWAKIRVPSTGVYQLTDELIRQAGFSDISKVRIYGYGGNLKNEQLRVDELMRNDDLPEVKLGMVGGKRVFFARGPVSWTDNETDIRTRNYCSDYGYYFLTEGTKTTPTLDAEEFVNTFYPTPDYYHDLYEVDGHAWYRGGRNLYDTYAIKPGQSYTITLPANTEAKAGKLTVSLTTQLSCTADVSFNGTSLGSISLNNQEPLYVFGTEAHRTYSVNNPDNTVNNVTITVRSGSASLARLDYVSMAWCKPHALPDLAAAQLPVPQYVYGITNQDHHADTNVDMVIIIPTSQKLLAQAQRLKEMHEQHDTMTVRIVPADELYNEFSSGTPDPAAYRNYLKMMYDRAETEAQQPKYLLLFGDCVWDNRLRTSMCSSLNADDYLLAYESENSFDKRSCYVDDGYFCMLDDGEGLSPLYKDKLDVAVGRIPVSNAIDAETVVDKIISYVRNANGGAWQNTIMFMGDDGDNNMHMIDANYVADKVISNHPGYVVKKVMWDAYNRVSTASGFTYPEVTSIIKKQQQQGALIMNYAGHGSEIQLSHEKVLGIKDFAAFNNANLPLWVTAACDIMPFDAGEETIGEAAMLNKKGGTVAFYGTTRTVYANYNTLLNESFMKHVLTYDDDNRPITLGEAQRRAKNDMTLKRYCENALQYSLLGDPAMRMHLPKECIVIDSINGIALSRATELVALKAGSLASVSGHVDGHDTFNGVVTLNVRDNLETIACRGNDPSLAVDPFEYTDRQNTIFSGSARVNNGAFNMTFAVPKDINYSNKTGLINVFAINDERTVTANGHCSNFIVGGSDIAPNDSIGPSLYCYLNSPDFVNGGNVNTTPYFVAQINDKDGINASGSGVGHDLQLIIDGRADLTYSLNDNFQFDFGSYTSGSTYYNIPTLTPGPHSLVFRAWDIQNNMSEASLQFNVVMGLQPAFGLAVTKNPARESTTFVITHDRAGADVSVVIDVFDMSGRHLWRHEENNVCTDSTYTINWDLTLDDGSRLQTGVYLYRAHVTTDGGTTISKGNKLVVIGNK